VPGVPRACTKGAHAECRERRWKVRWSARKLGLVLALISSYGTARRSCSRRHGAGKKERREIQRRNGKSESTSTRWVRVKRSARNDSTSALRDCANGRNDDRGSLPANRGDRRVFPVHGALRCRTRFTVEIAKRRKSSLYRRVHHERRNHLDIGGIRH